MKKLIVSAIVCLMAVSAYAIETTKCYLAHDGAMKVYDASKITTAITDAVKGDTIYLQAGTYAGFTLDKEITVRGVGDGNTTISSAVTIAIAGSPELSQTLLEGLNISSLVTLSKAMTGVKIKQCKFIGFDVSADNSGIELDRCWITDNFFQSAYMKGLTISNSKIYRIYASTGYVQDACKYINCNIYTLYSGNSSSGSSYTRYINGHFINSIIYSFSRATSNTPSYYYPRISNSVISNTLHLFDWSPCLGDGNVIQDCYYSTTYQLDSNCDLIDYTYEDLYNSGYKGNDDTVVGCFGGTSPFTLSLPIPKITSSDIYYDKDNKILEVTIQVTAK